MLFYRNTRTTGYVKYRNKRIIKNVQRIGKIGDKNYRQILIRIFKTKLVKRKQIRTLRRKPTRLDITGTGYEQFWLRKGYDVRKRGKSVERITPPNFKY